MKKALIFLLVTLTLISLFSLSTFAAQYNEPQDTFGLTACSIYYMVGSSTTIYSPNTPSSSMVTTSPYSSGLDIADLTVHQSIGTDTKITYYFYWSGISNFKINELCIKGIPADFHVTVSLTGVSSMTGSNTQTTLAPVDTQDGWTRYDNYSTSATLTPLLSSTTGMTITIDGGSAQLKTLADDEIILSLSLLPYNLNAASDLQYNIGYQDAQKIYKDILQNEKQNSYDQGVLKGYNDGIRHAEDVLIPEAEDLARADGYAEGKADGMSIAENGDLRDLVFAIPEAHLTALEGFTNWNLLGYNLYDLLGGLTTLVIVAAIFMIGIKFIL